jgi:PGF-pre-PGF domain-containing protein
MTGIKNHSYFGQMLEQISIVFLLTLLCFAFMTPACAQATVTIYPSSQDVYTNNTFSVYVDIEPEDSFLGAQLDIRFDRDIIVANKVEEGNLFGRDSTPYMFNKGIIDNSAGSVTGSYAVTLGGTYITEPGTFIRIDCTAQAKEGYSPLELSEVILSNSLGQQIPVTVRNGGIFVHNENDQPETIKDGPLGGDGGGSGGGSGTSEDAANISLKEVKTVNVMSNTNVSYPFSEQGNPVTSITYYSLKNAGQITSSIEVLKNVSVTATNVPPGTVYKHMNIWVGKHGYATPENIQGAVIGFRVSKEWMKINGFDPSSIRIYRFNNGEWRELQTNIAGDDQEFVFFKADTPGFSPFAITAFALATSSMESNYHVFMDTKTDIYEITEGPDLQNEASATGQDSDNEQTLGQNSALFLLVALISITIINVFLRKE